MTTLRERAERRAERLLRRAGVGRVMHPARAVRLVEFGAVGATGATVKIVTFVATVGLLHYLLAGFVAFVAGNTWSFALHRRVTFAEATGRRIHQYARFGAVTTAGFVFYTVALAVAVEHLRLDYLAAILVAVGTSGVWNFLGSELWAFGDR